MFQAVCVLAVRGDHTQPIGPAIAALGAATFAVAVGAAERYSRAGLRGIEQATEAACAITAVVMAVATGLDAAPRQRAEHAGR